jgi:hypothetical protein
LRCEKRVDWAVGWRLAATLLRVGTMKSVAVWSIALLLFVGLTCIVVDEYGKRIGTPLLYDDKQNDASIVVVEQRETSRKRLACTYFHVFSFI